MTALANWGLAGPEIFMAICAMGFMMLGVFLKGNTTRLVGYGAILVMAIAGHMALGLQDGQAFNGAFEVNGFVRYAKFLTVIAAAVTLALALEWLEKEKLGRFEYPVVMIFATLGMLMMISANDLMSLYMGLELQSLALYVVAAYNRNNQKSTESGLKYFILGSLASGMMLYGASMIYGFTGTTGFDGIAAAVSHDPKNIGIIVGLVFLLAGLAFKVSAAPFHMWTPDVYEGAPTPVTAFFAVAPKIAAMALFVRVMHEAFGAAFEQWQQVVILAAVASLIVGAIGAIMQTNIKRLMAYSSIGHVGFILMGLAAGTVEGAQGVLTYLTIYLVMNIGVFAVILSMRVNGRPVENISDLAGLSKTSPAMALAMAVLMFSMAGIPPMVGFFGKYVVVAATMKAGLVSLAIIAMLSSVVSAFYYLRVIKVMYFDDVAEEFDRTDVVTKGIMTASAILILVLSVILPSFNESSRHAAESLFAANQIAADHDDAHAHEEK